jgi:hypothetical protein
MKQVIHASAALSSSDDQLHHPGSCSGCRLPLCVLRLQDSCVSAAIDSAAKRSLRVG